MDWSWWFSVPTGLFDGYSLLAVPSWGAGLDVIPDVGSTVSDVVAHTVGIGGSGSNYAVDKATAPPKDPVSDISKDIPLANGGSRDIMEGNKLLCFDPGPGVWTSTAKAAGSYHEWYCPPDEDECFTTMLVPYNEEKAPGKIVALG